jgi:uracil-DNA glycosylase
LLLGDAQPSAQWLIVLDDATGLAPLLTVAEQVLLGNMLTSVGKQWCDVAVTSLLKCARSGDATLDAFSDEVQACQVFLQQQMALLKPQLLITMGSLAGQTLLGVDDELAQLVDDLHEFEGVPLLVMNHPSELLEQSALKAQAWKSLNRL